MRPVIAGVYLLFQDRKLTYVGRSNDIYRRIDQHRANGRPFDYAAVMALPEVDVAWIKSTLIEATKPPQNKPPGPPKEHRPVGRPPVEPEITLSTPRRVKPEPEILSVSGARRYLADRGLKLTGRFKAAVEAGRLPVVRHDKYQNILRADVDAWVLAELAAMGFNVGKS